MPNAIDFGPLKIGTDGMNPYAGNGTRSQVARSRAEYSPSLSEVIETTPLHDQIGNLGAHTGPTSAEADRDVKVLQLLSPEMWVSPMRNGYSRVNADD